MSANIEQIKAMLERAGKTNLLQKQKVDLDKERLQLEATVNKEKVDKSLKEAAEEYNSVKPAEWSEEDEKRLRSILFSIGYCKEEYPDKKEYSKDIAWLKSLRPSWKPSEEQIYSLGTVVKGYNECTVGSVGYNLKELYKQLKKLKEGQR